MKLSSFVLSISLVVWCAAILPLTSQAQDAAEPEAEADPVCITVNGVELLESELLTEITRITQEVMQRNPQGMNPMMIQQRNITFYEPARERSIRRILAIQLGKEKEMLPSEEEIDERLEGIKERFDSEEEFTTTLAERGTSIEDLRGMISEELMYRDVVLAEVPMSATPTAEELNAFYTENEEMFQQPETATASHILLAFNETMTDDDKAALKEKLAGIKKSIADEEVTFAEAAIEHSDDPGSGQRGGSLGAFRRGQMVKPFEDASFGTPVGEMSDIVESQFGYHLILVEDRTEAGVVPLADVEDQLATFLQNRAYEEDVNAFFEKLEADAEIVENMSEDEWKERNAPQPPAQAQPGQIQLPNSIRNQN